MQPRLEHPEVQGEADELLLGAVVQVALDPAAGVVGGLDDPQPRDPQLLHPRAELRLQALVVDRQRGGAGGGGDELGGGVELGVVDDRRQPHAAAVDRGPGAARAGVGERDGAAGVVDEDLALGQPVGDRQRAVAEPLGQQLADRAALGHARAQQPARRANAARRRRPPAPRSRRSSPAARAGRARARWPGRGPTGRRGGRRRPRARSPPARRARPRAARARPPATRPASAIGSLASSIAEHAPEGGAAELVADRPARRAAGPAAGGRPAGGWPGGARPPRAATRGGRCRRGSAGRPTTASARRRARARRRSPAGRSGPGRARRRGRAARGGRRAGAERGPGRRHDGVSTETSPLVLSAWTWKGASATFVRPRMRVVPESLWASIW